MSPLPDVSDDGLLSDYAQVSVPPGQFLHLLLSEQPYRRSTADPAARSIVHVHFLSRAASRFPRMERAPTPC